MAMTREESEVFAQICNDPVRWAETFLMNPDDPQKNLELRSYQREVLENTKTQQQIVLRYGRRMGKCNNINDLLTLSNGERITVGELWHRWNSGESLRLMNVNKDLSITESKPIIMEDNGFKETFKVITKSGKEVNITENHPLLTINGWVPLQDIKLRDRILVPSKLEYNTTKEIDIRLVKYLAYIISDGCIISRNTLTNNNPIVINEFIESLTYFDNITHKIVDRGNGAKDINVIKTKGLTNSANQYLKSIGLYGHKSNTKFVPKEIFTLSKQQQAVFISRIFSCDGWASVSKSNRKSGNCEIGYCSVSKDLIQGLSHLLVRFGIKHFVKEKRVKYNGGINIAYQILIRNKEDILLFAKDIGIFANKERVQNVVDHVSNRSDISNGYFYQVPKNFYEYYDVTDLRKHGIRKSYNTSKNKVLKLATDQNIQDLQNICTSDTYFDEVESITSNGLTQTYAIEVPDTHNYVVGDIITHNTVVLCADVLWWTVAQPLATMFNNGGTKQIPFSVLIMTPMDSQIKMIFDTLMSLIADSPYLKEQITAVKRSDVNEIHFRSGSVIKGMTLGISSANKGTSVRGQSADMLMLDEADFIPRDIMEQSVLPIANTKVDTKIRACSTPSGKRELFYSWCTQGLEIGWWSRHYPSWHHDNPNWLSIDDALKQGRPIIDSTEHKFRSVMAEDAYLREFGAEFGEESQGVYKHKHINSSLVNYFSNYDNHDTDIFDPGFEQKPGNKYVIGVDWNTYKNGGQIVMLEYCAEPTFIEYFDHETNSDVKIDCTGKLRLFYRKGVKVQDATQRETRSEIIRLMTYYKVDYLYVDYGAGDTNVEELTHYGKQHPSLGMSRKLFVIDSGASTEHYDPILQKMVKKRNKGLMINQSVISLEEGRLVLPKEEDSSHRLVNQMRGYVIKNVTSRGDFTYDGEDHVLDAFNLATYGFYYQFGSMLKTSYENKIKFINNPLNNTDYAGRNSDLVKQSILTKNNINIRDPEKPKYNKPRMLGGNRNSRNANAFNSTSRRQF
jgi:intein/homing endonuclease